MEPIEIIEERHHRWQFLSQSRVKILMSMGGSESAERIL